MCVAIPGRITEFLDDDRHFATVDVSGVRRNINVGLLKNEGIELGDWVLIHVGFAMSKISEAQAAEQLELLQMLGEAEGVLEEVKGYQFGEAEKEKTVQKAVEKR